MVVKIPAQRSFRGVRGTQTTGGIPAEPNRTPSTASLPERNANVLIFLYFRSNAAFQPRTQTVFMRLVTARIPVLFSLLCLVPLVAQVPQAFISRAPSLIRLKGSFQPANGLTTGTTEGLTVSIYRDQHDSVPLWQETQNVSVDLEGHYAALLGATQTNGFPVELLSSAEPVWLGVRFNRPGEAEQARIQLKPDALTATAETAEGKRVFRLTSSSSSKSLIVPTACAAGDCSGSLPGVPGFAAEFQQIYAASLFTAVGVTGPINITGVGVRPSPTNNTITDVDFTATINAKTTLTNPDLGCSFPDSTGCSYAAPESLTGATPVFSATQHFTTANSGVPRPFDFVITFSTPFQYDPTTGQNLLLDLSIPTNGFQNLTPSGDSAALETIGTTNRQPGTGAVVTLFGMSSATSGLVVDIFYTVNSIQATIANDGGVGANSDATTTPLVLGYSVGTTNGVSVATDTNPPSSRIVNIGASLTPSSTFGFNYNVSLCTSTVGSYIGTGLNGGTCSSVGTGAQSASAATGWLRASPTTGSTTSGTSPVTISVDPTVWAGLAASAAGTTYTGTVYITRTGGASVSVSPLAFTVTFTKYSQPITTTASGTVTFTGAANQGALTAQTFTVNLASGWASVPPDFTVDVCTNGASTTCPGGSSIPGSYSGYGYPAGFTGGQNASSWLSVTPVNGATGTLVTVGATTTNLSTGTYTGYIRVRHATGSTTSFSGTNPVVIPVTLTVNAAPGITAMPGPQTGLTFYAQQGGTAPTGQNISVTVANPLVAGTISAAVTPGGTITGSGVSFSAAVASGATNAAATVNVAVNQGTLAVGSYTGSVTISASDATNVVVPVTLIVTTTSVSPTGTIGFVASVGGPNPTAQPLSVSTAGANLNLGVGVNITGCTWLGASSNSSTTPATVTLSVNVLTSCSGGTGLPAGNYSANVTLSASGLTQVVVPVTLNVSAVAIPIITAVPGPLTGLSFQAQQGGSAPTGQSIAVTVANPQVAGTINASVTAGNIIGSGVSFTDSIASGATNAAATVNVSVNQGSLAPGSYAGSVTISASGATSVVIPVSLTVSAPTTSPHLFLQNSQNNGVSEWSMGGTNNATIESAPWFATAAAGWSLMATADMNRNGVLDLIFQNHSTGGISIWFMTGTGGLTIGSAPIVYFAAPNWNVVAAADMNGDGQPDLILQNTVTGQVSIWFMNTGGLSFSSAPVIATAAPGWQLVATGDVNQDGVTDLLFQNQASGQISVWFMKSGGMGFSSAPIVAAPASGWALIGTSAFGSNGDPDYVFQNRSTGAVSVWYITGTQGTTYSSAPIIAVAASGWSVLAAH